MDFTLCGGFSPRLQAERKTLAVEQKKNKKKKEEKTNLNWVLHRTFPCTISLQNKHKAVLICAMVTCGRH